MRRLLWMLMLVLGVALVACPTNPDDDDATGDDDDATGDDDDATGDDDDATGDDDDSGHGDDDDAADDDDSGHGDDDDAADDDDSGHGDDDDLADDDDASADDDDATADDDDSASHGDDDDASGTGGIATVWGAANDDVANALVITSGDERVVVGSFEGAVDLGGTSVLTSAGGSDIFVLNIAANGSVNWAVRFGGSGNDAAFAVGVDNNTGDLYVGGEFSDAVGFGGTTLTSAGGTDGFLMKLNALTGAVTWVDGFGSTGDDSVEGIGIDSFGNPLFGGTFEVSFDAGGPQPFASNGGKDVFVVRFDPNGTHFWTQTFGGTGDDVLNAFTLDANADVHIAGSFEDSIDFGGTMQTSAGLADVFVAKLSAFNSVLWSAAFGGAGNDVAEAVATGASSEVLVTGSFEGSVDFGTGSLASAGGADCFILQLTSAGATSAVTTLGGAGDEVGTVAADDGGTWAVGGTWTSSVLDLGDGLPELVNGGTDLFLGDFNSSGATVGSEFWGGTGDETFTSLVIGSSEIGTTGTFTGATELDQPYTSAGGTDMFMFLLL